MPAKTMTDVTLEYTLYDVLSKKTKYILKPDVFTNSPEFKNNMLVFHTMGVKTSSFVHSFKYYIPFSSNNTIIPEYNNGIYTVFLGYRILVIETPLLNDFSNAKIVGAYAMNSMKFREVKLNEDLTEISSYAVTEDMITVTRYVPKDIELSANMHEFFNRLKSGEEHINW